MKVSLEVEFDNPFSIHDVLKRTFIGVAKLPSLSIKTEECQILFNIVSSMLKVQIVVALSA